MSSKSAESYLIEEITKGKELMNRLNTLLNPHDDKSSDLSTKILESLSTALDLLDPKETTSLDVVATANQSTASNFSLKRKNQSTDAPSLRRRKVGDSKMVYMTSAPHCDGYQWRKYGQKLISNSSHPRTYYRCTYKDDQGCPATKKIQQRQCNEMYNDSPMFQVIYEHEHSCNSTVTDSEMCLS